ncbi:hypothetical protein [Methylobacterium sp. Leaf87]|nr:hypothetical protein [Methylobacterium sp. Leaf87]
MAAGLTAGYVARGRPYSPALRAPDITGETLLDVATAVVRSPSFEPAPDARPRP